MIRWIFWILVIFWLASKLKYLFADNDSNDSENIDYSKTKHSDNISNKKLSDNAGDYVDYEEIK